MSYKDPGPIRSYERDQFWIETIVFVAVTISMITTFVLPIAQSLFVSVLLSIFFSGAHTKLSKWTGETFSASILAMCTLAIPILPLFVGGLVAYYSATDLLSKLAVEGSPEAQLVENIGLRLEWLKEKFPILDQFIQIPSISDLLDGEGWVMQNFERVSTFVQSALGVVYVGVFNVVFWIVVIILGVYYQLRAGDAPMQFARTVIPIRPVFIDAIFDEFAQMTRTMIKVTLYVGLAQGLFAGIAMYVIGTPYWFLWMYLMIIMSMVPVAGAAVILGPVILAYAFAVPEWAGMTEAIFLSIVLVIVSTGDNWLKSRIVGNNAELPGALIMLGAIVGIIKLGPIGAIAGPIMIALGLAYYRKYIEKHSERHDDYLDHVQEQIRPVKVPWQSLSARVKRSRILPIKQSSQK